MAMGARIPMPTDAQLLTLAQWFSPAYPVGAFNFSHGLEAAVDAGQVCTRADLAEWLDTVMRHGAGTSDTLFLAASYFADSADAVQEINDQCSAFALSRERLDETEKQGAAFARVTAHVWGSDLPTLTYPVAVGRAAFLADLPLRATASCYLQAFIGNLISAAQRLMPLGQTDAQALLHDLSPLCAEIARQNADGDLSRVTGTAFLADVASMRHETQYSRIFQT